MSSGIAFNESTNAVFGRILININSFYTVDKQETYSRMYNVQLYFENFAQAGESWMAGLTWLVGRSLGTLNLDSNFDLNRGPFNQRLRIENLALGMKDKELRMNKLESWC